MGWPFVVLAALPEEAAAILRLFRSEPLPEAPPSFRACHKLYVGNTEGEGGCAGILAQLEGMGRVFAAVSTSYAISAWNPGFLVIAGTAGGFESNGVSLGDILVATVVLDYESQRLGSGPPSIRWATYHPDASLLALARTVALGEESSDWKSLGPQPHIHFGPILSGDKVVASERALRDLLTFRRDALGVEMEGAGVALAAEQAEKPFLMVRGVADYADDRKSEDSVVWSAKACELVARFLIELLESWARRTMEAK